MRVHALRRSPIARAGAAGLSALLAAVLRSATRAAGLRLAVLFAAFVSVAAQSKGMLLLTYTYGARLSPKTGSADAAAVVPFRPRSRMPPRAVAAQALTS